MQRQIKKYKQQNGAALILFILLLVVGATTLLVSKLNKAATQYYRDDVTMDALLEAKEALIGIAVSYPDMFSDPDAGPGFLPCPDTDGNGSPNPPCGSMVSTNHPIGRLPWEYIGLDDIRDSTGEQLWYAVSNNFKNNPKTIPLNSESSGQLSLDGVTDIVAVIIAPGEPVCSQNRPANKNDKSNYLEDVNANGLNDFKTQGNTTACNDFVTFNDIILPITRTELMHAVEQRVLGELKETLKTYKSNYLTYPWLSPFNNPQTSQYDSAPLTYEGLLPIHFDNEVFMTPIIVEWDIKAADGATVTPSGVVLQSDLEAGVVSIPSAQCRWKDKVNETSISGGVNTHECFGSVTIGTRAYQFDFGFNEDIAFDGIVTLPYDTPTSSETRTREVIINGSLPKQPASKPIIEISEGADKGTVSIENNSSGYLRISGIRYDLNNSPGERELPQWFTKNNWERLFYIALSSEYAPGGSGNCTTANCLIVDGYSPENTSGAIIISAGQAIASQNRSTGTLADYLENKNNTPADNEFMRNTYPPVATYDPVFNDQMRIIEP